MHKLCLLVLAGASISAQAQTPAPNLMPDGSRDMFVGLGASVAPIYDGASERKTRALPALQIQWSNGVFIAGQAIGMHWSNEPAIEFGPLAALVPRRTDSGTGGIIGGVGDAGMTSIAPPGMATITPPMKLTNPPAGTTRLTGLADIATRVEVGGFAHVTLAPGLRLTNTVLYGAGNERNGLRWTMDVQRIAADLAPHHTVVLSAGMTVANAHYNQAYFGVTPAEAVRSVNTAYSAAGGIKDLHAGLRWNWALHPEWMLSSGVALTRLAGSAAGSPLVERRNTFTASTVLAYRF